MWHVPHLTNLHASQFQLTSSANQETLSNSIYQSSKFRSGAGDSDPIRLKQLLGPMHTIYFYCSYIIQGGNPNFLVPWRLPAHWLPWLRHCS